MATLKVENISGALLELLHDDGVQKQTFNPGDQIDLDAGFLLSPDFKVKIGQGKLQFVAPPNNPAEDAIELARQVLPVLLEDLGSEILALYATMKRSMATLERLRVEYNTAHKATKKLITDTKAFEKGADLLAKAAAWLTTKPEDDAVAEAQQDIIDHQAAVPGAPGPAFDAWYAALLDLQNALAAAKANQAYAASRLDYAVAVAALRSAFTDLSALDPAVSIGSEVAPFP
ncbi:MAG: hypothetical protein H6730_12720 [Deltaproteobacteria bacterium]|nr:hypothetical protein [Deltaproteobacteria bacterium]